MGSGPSAPHNLEELGSGNTGKLLLKYSWPALVAMSLNALYVVVDRVFIGHGCGTDAMAGLTLTMPLMMLFAAFGVFVGAGHASTLSIKLGEGNREACEKIVGQLVAFKLAFFVTIPPLVFIFLDEVLGLCGADKVTPGAFASAKTYLRIVLFSHLFSHLAFGLSALQRAEGGAKRSMMAMVVGFGTNLILDPIFIFGFGMGIAGAAWATNIAMALSCLWALQYYVRGKTAVRLEWRRIGFYREYAARAAAIGFGPFLQQLLSALIAVSIQMAFSKWITDEAQCTAQIASLGVFQSVLILMVLPIMGTQQGLQPIIGFNWGARQYRRVLGTVKLGFWVTTWLCVGAFVAQVVPPFPYWLARLFVEGKEMVELAAKDLQLSNCMLWCIGINVVATTYFQSIGKPKTAIILSTLRQGVVMIPCIWLMPYVLADKPLAIWIALPVSDAITALATIPPLLSHARFLSRVRDYKRKTVR